MTMATHRATHSYYMHWLACRFWPFHTEYETQMRRKLDSVSTIILPILLFATHTHTQGVEFPLCAWWSSTASLLYFVMYIKNFANNTFASPCALYHLVRLMYLRAEKCKPKNCKLTPAVAQTKTGIEQMSWSIWERSGRSENAWAIMHNFFSVTFQNSQTAYTYMKIARRKPPAG